MMTLANAASHDKKIAATLALTALLLASPTSAQERGSLDAQGFRPSTSPYSIFSIDAADTCALADLSFGALLNYASTPLVTRREGSDRITPLVDQQLALHMMATVGLIANTELSAEIPLLMINNGARGGQDFGGATFGDLNLRLKGTAMSSRERAVGLGAMITVSLPTGDQERFAGDGYATGSPELIFDTRLGPLLLAANAGLTLRTEREVLGATFGSEITFGAGAQLVAYEELLDVALSVQGRTQLRDPFGDKNLTPVEALFGVKMYTPAGFFVTIAGGPALVGGVSASEMRAIVAINWSASLRQPAADPEPSSEEPKEDTQEETTSDEAATPDQEKPVEVTPPPKPTGNARIDGDRIVFNKGKVGFRLGSDKPRDTAPALLDELAAFLLSEPTLRVELGMHTDTLGDPEENLELSERQAKVVRDYLISRGVAADRLEVKGYGGESPLIPEEMSDEDEETNRRLEVKILSR